MLAITRPDFRGEIDMQKADIPSKSLLQEFFSFLPAKITYAVIYSEELLVAVSKFAFSPSLLRMVHHRWKESKITLVNFRCQLDYPWSIISALTTGSQQRGSVIYQKVDDLIDFLINHPISNPLPSPHPILVRYNYGSNY